MARHLEFDRDEVVARATDVFWETGYTASPTPDIAAAMGVAKSSLYNTFGSKRDLFIASLDYYSSSQRSMIVDAAKSRHVLVLLRQLLLDIVVDNNAGRGCLLVNTAAEFGARDDAVRQHVKAGFDSMVDAFTTLIRAGQKAGHIHPAVKAPHYALTLITGIAGLRILAKSGFTDADLSAVIKTMLAGLAK